MAVAQAIMPKPPATRQAMTRPALATPHGMASREVPIMVFHREHLEFIEKIVKGKLLAHQWNNGF